MPPINVPSGKMDSAVARVSLHREVNIGFVDVDAGNNQTGKYSPFTVWVWPQDKICIPVILILAFCIFFHNPVAVSA